MLANLGATLAGAGKLEEAHETLSQSVDWHRRLLGETHPGTANAMLNLGSVLYRLEQYSQSEKLFRKCVAIFSVPDSRQSPTLGIANINLANSLLKQGSVQESLAAATDGLAQLQSNLPASHPWIAVAMESLGAAKAETGDVREGVELLESSLPLLIKTFGEHGARTREVQEVLQKYRKRK